MHQGRRSSDIFWGSYDGKTGRPKWRPQMTLRKTLEWFGALALPNKTRTSFALVNNVCTENTIHIGQFSTLSTVLGSTHQGDSRATLTFFQIWLCSAEIWAWMLLARTPARWNQSEPTRQICASFALWKTTHYDISPQKDHFWTDLNELTSLESKFFPKFRQKAEKSSFLIWR